MRRSSLLQEHPYVAEEKQPMDAVGESIDIFVCCSGTGLEKPVLSLARIKSDAGACQKALNENSRGKDLLSGRGGHG